MVGGFIWRNIVLRVCKGHLLYPVNTGSSHSLNADTSYHTFLQVKKAGPESITPVQHAMLEEGLT